MYLQLLEKNKIVPNFWCSEEYFEKAGWEQVTTKDNIIIYDKESYPMLPSLSLETPGNIYYPEHFWASLPYRAFFTGREITKSFLDHNFIYDPKAFLNLSGGKWAVFRKNIKKFPVNKNLFYEELSGAQGGLEALSCWLNNRKADEVIHDDDVILKYVTDGKNKKFLFDNDNIYGVNIWDENYMFINYRYCFCQNIPFLSEYMRYRFYTDPEILNSGKKVNDGGCLDNPDLYKFKMRLNPEMVYNIYTTL